jgi:hypothetical protein
VTVAAVVAVALTAAGCGSDSPSTASDATAAPPAPATGTTAAPTTTTTTTARPTTTTVPCGVRTTPPASTARRLRLRRPVDAASPLRVLVAGDSIAVTLGPSVKAALPVPPAQLSSAAFPGYGFTSGRPGIVDGRPTTGVEAFRDWQRTLDDAIAQHDPDVVVILLGSWDLVPREVDGGLLDPSQCAWVPWYRSLVDEAWRRLTARGARIVWLGFPCAQRETDPHHHTLNGVFASLAADHPRSVAYVDLDALVCPGGRVAVELPGPDGRPTPVREPDGTHFDFWRAHFVLGPVLHAQLARLLPLSPSAP